MDDNALMARLAAGDTEALEELIARHRAAAMHQAEAMLGDHALGEIHNEAKADGSSVLVVKESFGNAFVPFLVDSYEYVYVVDARYYDGDLTQFVTSYGIDEVIFINNLSATGSSARMDELEDFIG